MPGGVCVWGVGWGGVGWGGVAGTVSFSVWAWIRPFWCLSPPAPRFRFRFHQGLEGQVSSATGKSSLHVTVRCGVCGLQFGGGLSLSLSLSPRFPTLFFGVAVVTSDPVMTFPPGWSGQETFTLQLPAPVIMSFPPFAGALNTRMFHCARKTPPLHWVGHRNPTAL